MVLRLILSCSLVLAGCSSAPKRVVIDEFVNTVTSDSIIQGGVRFTGSSHPSYNNVSNEDVLKLNDVVKTWFIAKYKPDAQINSIPRFNLSYTILSNDTFQSEYYTDEKSCYRSYRKMKIQLYLAENKTNENAWGGEISQTLFDENCNPQVKSQYKSDNIGGQFVEALIDISLNIASDAVFGTYPQAPSIDLVTRKILNGFSEHLPSAG